jgi:SAM-dependent methyltransferase
MKTTISPTNPFGVDLIHWAYGWELIHDNDTVLDYGCFDGKFLNTLRNSKVVDVYGVDKNKDIVDSLNQGNVFHIRKALPFPDGVFNVVTMFEVLEHVYDQRYVLSEIRRVLKDGGLLIMSMPRRHVFTFLDHGNWKYAFPRVHRYWYTRRHSAEEYHYRYVDNPSGLIGDVDKEKAWHQHFRAEELSDLLASSAFAVSSVDGYGLFMLPLELIRMLRVPIPKWLDRFDTTRFNQAKLLCVARKETGRTAGAGPERDDQPVRYGEERREPAYSSA